jgi:hypothetical protein
MDCAWASPRTRKWPKLLAGLHAAVRKAAPKLTLVLQGGCWGSAQGLTDINPSALKDDNILWSFHSYEPFLLTHQGASWTGGAETYVHGLTYPPDRLKKSEMLGTAVARIKAARLPAGRQAILVKRVRERIKDYFRPGWAASQIEAPLELVVKWAKRHKVPHKRILLGEFGVIRSDQGPPTPDTVRAELMAATRKAAEARGFGWAVWSWGGAFGLTVSDDNRVFRPLLLEALGLDPRS